MGETETCYFLCAGQHHGEQTGSGSVRGSCEEMNNETGGERHAIT